MAVGGLAIAVVVLAVVVLLLRKPLLGLGLLGAVAILAGVALFWSIEQPVAVGPRTVVISTDASSAAGPNALGVLPALPAIPPVPVPTWENGVLTLIGQAPLSERPDAAEPARDRAEARRAARRQATQTLVRYLAQLRQVAPAYLADVQSLLRRLPDVEHAQVVEAVVHGATIEEHTSDTGCTVRIAIGRDELCNALGAGRRYARRAQSSATGLAAVGLVVVAGVILRASTRRVRAART